jgi:hypothetical protein
MATRKRKTATAPTTDTVPPDATPEVGFDGKTLFVSVEGRRESGLYEIMTRREGQDVRVRSAGSTTSGQDVENIDILDLEPGLYTVRVTPVDPDADVVGPRPFRLHTRVTGDEATPPPPTVVTLTPRKAAASASNALWEEIRIWSDRRRFENYELYIRDKICPPGGVGLAGVSMDEIVQHTRDFLAGRLNGELLEDVPVIDVNRLAAYDIEGDDIVLPYLTEAAARYPELAVGDPCNGIDPMALTVPFAVELLWSYWHEEGGLVQTLNHILARFQNRRTGPGPDPMARFDLSPLRPLRNLLFEWTESESDRLTVRRRAAEYEYEYGLSMVGRAVPRTGYFVERRTTFVQAFHQLLHTAYLFFREEDDTTVNADPFPLLNALRETHLVLAEGAHNQYGDLPTVAREQMLIMQLILAQSEMRDFLGGRPMVPYEEAWMDRVDAMKAIQGWTDTSITHFRDLGFFGERLLLSIRLDNWNSYFDAEIARGWAATWRNEVQRYIHAYRTATGADLMAGADATMPSALLARRESGRRGA